ncbi:MAG: hypothetical protein AAGC64_03310 [Bacteroidota bacterium]
MIDKSILLITVTFLFSLDLFAQDKDEFSYACILVENKSFSKKLNVRVDFGDSPEQIEAGKEYSELFSNKKSVAAILNYMVKNRFELVETLSVTDGSYEGTSSGTSGIIFIMKRNDNDK